MSIKISPQRQCVRASGEFWYEILRQSNHSVDLFANQMKHLLVSSNILHKMLQSEIKYRLFFFRSIVQIFTYTNLHQLFCQFMSWTIWVNSSKFMDNYWISCKVMADMKFFYSDLIIINLYWYRNNLRKVFFEGFPCPAFIIDLEYVERSILNICCFDI